MRAPLVLALLTGGCVVEYSATAQDGGGSSGSNECAAGMVQCGEACVTPSSNPDHCGGCGQACAVGDVCDEGMCGSSCRDGRTPCARACVDVETDPVHCGECGESCDVDGACVQGDCIDACNDECDEHTEICIAGQCGCRSELTVCGSDCVDLQTDSNHCGECDEGCSGDPCGAGACVEEGCPGFPAQCGDSCTDLATDPVHCGECDHACKGDETCVGGDCTDD